MSHRPPKNDRERLQNLIEALAEPGDGDDAFDEEARAELARRGLTLETWAAQIRARAQAVLDQNRRARRVKALKIAAAAAAVVVAARMGLALHASPPCPAGEAFSTVLESRKPLPPRVVLDAGVDASRRE